jgi:hypothetical protein
MTKSYMKRLMSLSKPKRIILMIVGAIFLILPAQTWADKNPEEVKISPSIYPGLHHFLDLVDPEKNVSFDPGLVARVMEFIESSKDEDSLYFADDVLDMSSAYHEFDSRTDLQKISDYAFNPDVPCIATMPSSVRLFHWLDEKGQRRHTPQVNRYLGNLDTPMVERAQQYVEITPDTHSGAYYGYDLDQTLIVFKYRQRKVLITVSRQTDVSSVGKKGYVLAADFSRIRKFSDDTLRSKMNTYSHILQRRYNGENQNGKQRLSKLLADRGHWSGMSRDEMEAALVIEYMKGVIGKTPAAEIEELLEFKTVRQ